MDISNRNIIWSFDYLHRISGYDWSSEFIKIITRYKAEIKTDAKTEYMNNVDDKTK